MDIKELLVVIKRTIEKHGYSLSVQGSIDPTVSVILVPWADRPDSPEKLIVELSEALTTTPKAGPERGPHGRRSWLFQIGRTGELTVHVMPRFSLSGRIETSDFTQAGDELT